MPDLTTLLSKFLVQLYAGNIQAGGDGTSSLPTYSFASQTGLGFYRVAANKIGIANPGVGASAPATVFSNFGIILPSGLHYAWTSSATDANGTQDTNMSRISAGVTGFGNGTIGNTTGTVQAAAFQTMTALVALGGGAAPTVGTIGGSGPATAAQNTWLRMVDSTGTAFFVPVWK